MLALQSEGSKNRGIGRYSYDLSRAVISLAGEQTLLLYNEDLSGSEQGLLGALSSESGIPCTAYTLPTKTCKKVNTLAMTRQIDSFGPAIVHFHSVFEGIPAHTAWVMESFSGLKNAKVSVTAYDLIPFLYPSYYLKDEKTRQDYYKRLRLFYDADLIASISEATKNDIIDHLGIEEERIVTIGGAVDKALFYQETQEEKEISKKKLQYMGILRPYLLYTGGIDFRKNIDRTIEAYAALDPSLRKKHQFVIVCKISHAQRRAYERLVRKLGMASDEVVFTGYVPDDTLRALYNHCKLFVFPSIYEGFGLPVLEALRCGAAVAVSDSSSLPEIVSPEHPRFDPEDRDSITKIFSETLRDEILLRHLRKIAHQRAEMFSWEHSAQKLLEAFGRLRDTQKKGVRKKVAYFSPLPPSYSGISDYSKELLPFLLTKMDIDLFVENPDAVNDPFIEANFSIYDHRCFPHLAEEYHTVIYQMGNSHFHHYMLPYIQNYPGIVVLHDLFLGGMYAALPEGRSKSGFENLLRRCNDSSDRLRVFLENGKWTRQDAIDTLPFHAEVLKAAERVVVHSDYAKMLIEQHSAQYIAKTEVVAQIVWCPSHRRIAQKEVLRKRLGINSDRKILAMFGIIHQAKHYEILFKALDQSTLLEDFPLTLYMVGDFSGSAEKKYFERALKDHGLSDRVIVTGRVSDESYRDYLVCADISTVLRRHSKGETSRALLMNMAYGLPTIVERIGTFDDYPDNTVAKIPPGDSGRLARVLRRLLEDNSYRDRLAQRSTEYIRKYHGGKMIAEEYSQIVDRVSDEKNPANFLEILAETIVEERCPETELRRNERRLYTIFSE